MLPITKKISKYNFSSRNGQTIKYIVLHYTGTKTSDSALNNAIYFGSGYRGASAHYFVDNTSIYQVVEDYNAAWHCGDGNGNYGITNENSISIEMCGIFGNISKETKNNTLELTLYLMDKFNIEADMVVRHYDASRKICPNPWSEDNWKKWNEFKSLLRMEENILNKIVLYYGDVDAFPALIVAQKFQCPLMKYADFYASGLAAKEIIQVGGKPEDRNRYQTFKNAATLV